MERAYQTLSTQTADEAFARLAAQLGRLYFFKGDADTASERIETALDVAERLRLPEIISEALNTKAIVDQYLRGRNEEAMALMKHALEIALEHDISQSALRAYNNLASIIEMADRFEETLSLIDAAVDLARRVGDRPWEVAMAGGSLTSLNLLGRWDEAIASYVRRNYNLLIGERTAESIKIEIGSACELEGRLYREVSGRDLIAGIPKTITISDAEIREALSDSVAAIVNGVRVALEKTPPELSADIFERGV